MRLKKEEMGQEQQQQQHVRSEGKSRRLAKFQKMKPKVKSKRSRMNNEVPKKRKEMESRSEVKDFLQRAQAEIQRATRQDSSALSVADTLTVDSQVSNAVETFTLDEAGVDDSYETGSIKLSISLDCLTIATNEADVIEHRIKALVAAADGFYKSGRNDEALFRYTEILTLAKPLSGQSSTSCSDMDDEKQILYQKVIANCHAQIGTIKESLGNPTAAMKDYCVALTHYQIYRDWLSLQLSEPQTSHQTSRLRSMIDKADNRMGALLAKMGKIQMQSENMNCSFAIELNESALSVFKNLRLRIITKTGGEDLTPSEIEDQIITVLDRLAELYCIQGDNKAARDAYNEAFRLEKREEQRGGTLSGSSNRRQFSGFIIDQPDELSGEEAYESYKKKFWSSIDNSQIPGGSAGKDAQNSHNSTSDQQKVKWKDGAPYMIPVDAIIKKTGADVGFRTSQAGRLPVGGSTGRIITNDKRTTGGKHRNSGSASLTSFLENTKKFLSRFTSESECVGPVCRCGDDPAIEETRIGEVYRTLPKYTKPEVRDEDEEVQDRHDEEKRFVPGFSDNGHIKNSTVGASLSDEIPEEEEGAASGREERDVAVGGSAGHRNSKQGSKTKLEMGSNSSDEGSWASYNSSKVLDAIQL